MSKILHSCFLLTLFGVTTYSVTGDKPDRPSQLHVKTNCHEDDGLWRTSNVSRIIRGWIDSAVSLAEPSDERVSRETEPWPKLFERSTDGVKMPIVPKFAVPVAEGNIFRLHPVLHVCGAHRERHFVEALRRRRRLGRVALRTGRWQERVSATFVQ